MSRSCIGSLALALLALLCLPGASPAITGGAVEDEAAREGAEDAVLGLLSEYVELMDAALDRQQKFRTGTAPTPPFMMDYEGIDHYIREKIDRERAKLVERKKAVAWTNFEARVVFLVVHVGLVLALCIAVLEFVEVRRVRRRAESLQKPEESREVQEFQVSLEGVAIKTSLQGILLLGIAFAFYLLYVRFVYPVQVVGG